MSTGVSGGQNSARTWRHAPHGAMGSTVSATTATAVMVLAPSEMALKTAVRSAQLVRPSVEFSIFAPVKIKPSARTAAPT